jgi:hypothetical protein
MAVESSQLRLLVGSLDFVSVIWSPLFSKPAKAPGTGGFGLSLSLAVGLQR